MKIFYNITKSIIDSKILIALAALLFTISTPILVGENIKFYHFYTLIFFSTLFEYNLHNIDYKNLKSKNNQTSLIFCIFSALIVIITCFYADFHIFILLIPFGLISIFYTISFYKLIFNLEYKSQLLIVKKSRIKDIPYLKIFAISLVWSLVSTLPFIFKPDFNFNNYDLILVMIEKFLFIFAITLPFDIRDRSKDLSENIKTLPHLLNLSNHTLPIILILLLTILQLFHYINLGQYPISIGLLISNIICILMLRSPKLQKSKYYFYGFIDSTIIVQSLSIIIANSLFYLFR